MILMKAEFQKMLMKNGEEKDRLVGLMSLDKLRKKIDHVIESQKSKI